MADDPDEVGGDELADDQEDLTPTPASQWRRSPQQRYTLSVGDMPGFQAFFRELNQTLSQQLSASEAFARVAQQQRAQIVRLFESSSALANLNKSMESVVEQLARAAMPIENYRRLAAVLIANMPRDVVIEVPTIESTVQFGEPSVAVETGPRKLMGVRLDVMSIGLIVFWIYFLHGAIDALADGDVAGFRNYLGVAIGCAYMLYEYDKRQS